MSEPGWCGWEPISLSHLQSNRLRESVKRLDCFSRKFVCEAVSGSPLSVSPLQYYTVWGGLQQLFCLEMSQGCGKVLDHRLGGGEHHSIADPGDGAAFVSAEDAPSGVDSDGSVTRCGRCLCVATGVDLDVAMKGVAVAAGVVLLFQGLSGGAGECISLSPLQSNRLGRLVEGFFVFVVSKCRRLLSNEEVGKSKHEAH